MDVHLLVVPYDTARRGWRMGAGPERLLQAGLVEHLQEQGHHVRVAWVADDAGEPAEIGTAFRLMRQLAPRVRASRERGAFPLVLAGNCNTALGTLAGLPPDRPVAFWFDAHGDLNTPGTTTSGFLDGMALATILGRCWSPLAATVPGFQPLTADRVLLLGARDLDPPETDLIADSGLTSITAADIATALPARLERMALREPLAYIHCDLDVLDPTVGRANRYAVPGGLTVEGLNAAIRQIGARMIPGAATISAYAPEYDTDDGVCRAAFRIAAALVAAAAADAP